MRDILILLAFLAIFSLVSHMSAKHIHNSPRAVRGCELTTLLHEHTALTSKWEIGIGESCEFDKSHITYE